MLLFVSNPIKLIIYWYYKIWNYKKKYFTLIYLPMASISNLVSILCSL